MSTQPDLSASRESSVATDLDSDATNDDLVEAVTQLVEENQRLRDRISNLEDQLAQRSQLEEKVEDLLDKIRDADEPAPPFPVRWLQWWQSR
jgi:hypothetical protein